jgi:hypothetical protein
MRHSLGKSKVKWPPLESADKVMRRMQRVATDSAQGRTHEA